MKLDHAKLVKLAAKWLRRNHPVIVTELASSGREEPDAIGWRSGGYSTLVECKASRADFLRDQKKIYRRDVERGLGYKRYYMAPSGMLTRDDLPLGWGLLEVSETLAVRETLGATPLTYDARSEIMVLLSVVRRFGVTPGIRGVNIKAYTFKDVYGGDYESKNRATLGVADG